MQMLAVLLADVKVATQELARSALMVTLGGQAQRFSDRRLLARTMNSLCNLDPLFLAMMEAIKIIVKDYCVAV
jgi:hypothetical protein